MPMLSGIIPIIIAYLLGSIPVAYIITRFRKGIDIRDVGVRNMGGANVFREVGKWEGVLTLILDIGKGALGVLIAGFMGASLPWIMAAGFAGMLGHNYPVFIGFRGGKGIAVITGIFFVISPPAMASSGAIIGIAIIFTHNVFVAIEIASPFFLFFVWLWEGIGTLFFFTVAVVAFQLFRSRGRLKEIKTLTSRFTRAVK